MPRRLLLALAVLLLVAPAGAAAKSYELSRADERMVVARDGSIAVSERLTFRYEGSYRGADRVIDRSQAFASRLQVDRVGVRDVQAERTLRPGDGKAPARGAPCPAGRFWTVRTAATARIAWCHRSEDEERTFVLTYRLRGAVTRRSDGLLLGLVMWPSRWAVPVRAFTARITTPGKLGDIEAETSGRPRADPEVSGRTMTLRSGTRGAGSYLHLAARLPAAALGGAAEVPRTSGTAAAVVAQVGGGRALVARDDPEPEEEEEPPLPPGTVLEPFDQFDGTPDTDGLGAFFAVGVVLVAIFAGVAAFFGGGGGGGGGSRGGWGGGGFGGGSSGGWDSGGWDSGGGGGSSGGGGGDSGGGSSS